MIPAYNEAAGIEDTLQTITGYLDKQTNDRHHPNLGKGASVEGRHRWAVEPMILVSSGGGVASLVMRRRDAGAV